MKKKLIFFLITTLVIGFSTFIIKSSAYNPFGGLEKESACSFFGAGNACDIQIEYGCPKEQYFGEGDIPEEDIVFGSDVKKRTISLVCTESSGPCEPPNAEEQGGDWEIEESCSQNEYCDKNDTGDFYCHLAEQCDPNNFGNYPNQPISPQNNSTELIRPLGIDWCDVEGISLYKIKLHKVDDEGHETYLDTMESFSSNYCLQDLEKNQKYMWELAYCRDLDGNNCSYYQDDWYFTIGSESRTVKPPKNIQVSVSFTSGNIYNGTTPMSFEWKTREDEKSYFLEIYDEDGEEPVFMDVIKRDEENNKQKLEDVYLKPGSYEWHVASCLNNNGTACGDYCCQSLFGSECADFNNFMSFAITDVDYQQIEFDDITTFPYYDADKDAEDESYEPPTIAPLDYDMGEGVISSSLEWKPVLGEVGYKIVIFSQDESSPEVMTTSTKSSLALKDVWGDLNNDEIYNWRVIPCSDMTDCLAIEPSDSEYINTASPIWKFKTSGGEIEILHPNPNELAGNPLRIEWVVKSGTPLSYRYEVDYPVNSQPIGQFEGGMEGFSDRERKVGTTTKSSAIVEYPEAIIFDSVGYSVSVKSCANEKFDFCSHEETTNFDFGELKKPTNPYPENGGEIFTSENYLSWSPNPLARAYQYRIEYVAASEIEKSQECLDKAGTAIVDSQITLDPSIPLTKIQCLGQYRWFVKSCFNEDCLGFTTDETNWDFEYSQREFAQRGSIMPCGRNTDNLDTPWNEREICSLKHVPILFYSILDFILWKGSIVVFILLIIASILVSYASAGVPVQTIELKTLWKSAGQGYLIMFFAWTLVSLLLNVLGITEISLNLPF